MLIRAFLLGVAAGSRSSLGVAGPVLSSPAGKLARFGALASVVGELTADKLPSATARTLPPSLAGRVGSAMTGAVALARRNGRNPVLPALAGAAGAAAGTYGGLAFRQAVPGVPAALAEDAVAVGLTVLAVRRSPGLASPGRRRS